MADSIRMIRIRQYQLQDLIVTAQLSKESYKPGDLALGTLTVQPADGSQIDKEFPPSYSYVASFGSNLTVSIPLTPLNQSGTFTLQIPSSTNVSYATVAFTVRYMQMVVPYTLEVAIAQPGSVVIDFFPETYNYAYGVPVKVYYQAYSDASRTVPIDIRGLQVIGTNKSSNGEVVTVANNLDTLSLGRGVFRVTPSPDIEYSMLDGSQSYPLNITQQVGIEDLELTFSVASKVLDND